SAPARAGRGRRRGGQGDSEEEHRNDSGWPVHLMPPITPAPGLAGPCPAAGGVVAPGPVPEAGAGDDIALVGPPPGRVMEDARLSGVSSEKVSRASDSFAI